MGPSRGVHYPRVRSASVREWNDTAGPAGVGACGWGRAVVTVCDEPLARGGGAVARVGPVWFGAHRFAGGHFEMLRFAVGGLAGCEVVTELSQAVRNMVGRREIR